MSQTEMTLPYKIVFWVQVVVRLILLLLIPFLIVALDISFIPKVLLICLWICVSLSMSLMIHYIEQLIYAVGYVGVQTRLAFIAVHIRNEKNELPSAWARLQEDLESEQRDESIRRTLSGEPILSFALNLLRVAFYMGIATLLVFALSDPNSVKAIIFAFQQVLGISN